MTSHQITHDLGHWWTVLTAIYLHGGLLHIFFNILWIRQLGPQVAEAYGPARFFVIFTVSGAIGFVLSNQLSGAWTVGASGSIFGLLAALIVYGRRVGGRMGSLFSRQIWQWAILLFAFGFIMQGVNNWAHLGGFIGGWATALAMGQTPRESRGVTLLAVALLAATVLGFVLSLARSAYILGA
jgi:rhomboid protease GluP